MSTISSYLTYHVGKEVFATDVKFIKNIIEQCKITEVPHMPKHILGVMNLRGDVIPVVDSRIKLGLTATSATINTCIIVLELTIEGKETKVGMLVDEVSEVMEIDESTLQEAPTVGSGQKSGIINKVFPLGDKFIMLLDIHKVIASSEILSLLEAL